MDDREFQIERLISRMLDDEAAHAHRAKLAGAARFPAPVKAGMSLIAKAMTSLSYRV